MSFFVPWFYFFLGTFCTLYVVLLMYGEKAPSKTKEKDNEDGPVFRFYLNIFLLNTKDVLHNIVRSKISKNSPMLRATAKRLIVRLVKDETLATRIGGDLCSTIPLRLGNIGVLAVATVVYHQSSFICVEVDIMSVDPRKVIEKSTRGSAALATFEKLAKSLAWLKFEQHVEAFLTKFVCKKLLTSLPQTIVEKLQLKLTADIELITLTEAEQGPFLISTMQELNAGKIREENSNHQ